MRLRAAPGQIARIHIRESHFAIDRFGGLAWRIGIKIGPTRERVRTARALEDLPQTADALREGSISYAKVRALTRVATPESEAKRTAFYCERDVARHMQRWAEAASEKRVDQFEIPWDASFFHPRHRRQWPRPLH